MARQDPSTPSAPALSLLKTIRIDANAMSKSAPEDLVDFQELLASRQFRRAGLFVPREMLEHWKDIQP